MKVLCIGRNRNRDSDPEFDYLFDLLEIGRIYTVTEIISGDYIIPELVDDLILWEKESFVVLSENEMDENKVEREELVLLSN